MTRRGAVVLAVLLALGAPAMAQTEAPPEGYLTAFVCETLVRPVRVTSQILDNTDENVRLHALLTKELAKEGITLSDDAALTMSFEVRRVSEAERRKPGDLLDVRVGEDEETLGREGFARIHMNIWSTARDSILGGRRDTVENLPVDRLRISLTINRKADGRCLWRGEVVQNLNGRDAHRTADLMIPILAASVGTSVRQRPIEID